MGELTPSLDHQITATARQIIRESKRSIPNNPGNEIIWATVHSIQTGPPATLTLYLQGVSSNPVAGIAFLNSYVPTVNDRVMCSKYGQDIVVIGLAGSTSSGFMLTSVYDPAGIAQQVVGTTASQTLTNKRVTKRVYAYSAPGATPTINTDNYDVVNMTGLAAAITSMTTNLSGTPGSFDSLILGFTDNGTARAITWGTSFEASTVALPTRTVISTLLLVGFFWNPTTSKWRCVAVA